MLADILPGPKWFTEQFVLRYFMIDLRRMDVSTKNFDDCPPVKTYVYVASRQPQDEAVKCFASLDSDSEVLKVLFN